MDVRLSPEQQALRETAAKLADRLGPGSVAALGDGERAAALESAVAGAGWRELRAADAGGAPWASGVETAMIAEECGRGLLDVSFLGPTLAADLRRRAGAPAADSTETVALTADLGALASATSGRPPPGAVAIDAPCPTVALLLVPVEGGLAVGEVAAEPRGDAIDLTRPVARIDDRATVALVPGQQRLVTDDDLAAWAALALALTSADLVGVMRGAVSLACDYATARHQYGHAIGSYQAVQHLLADAFVASEGSSSAALHAAWSVDALDPADAVSSAALAKAYSARAARTVCETAIQVHGGIGNTWDCLAHVFLRRALLSADILGGAGPNLRRVLAHRGIGGSDGLR